MTRVFIANMRPICRSSVRMGTPLPRFDRLRMPAGSGRYDIYGIRFTRMPMSLLYIIVSARFCGADSPCGILPRCPAALYCIRSDAPCRRGTVSAYGARYELIRMRSTPLPRTPAPHPLFSFICERPSDALSGCAASDASRLIYSAPLP